MSVITKWLCGYVLYYDKEYVGDGFRRVYMPNCFNLNSPVQVPLIADFSHRKTIGVANIQSDQKGLWATCDLFDDETDETIIMAKQLVADDDFALGLFATKVVRDNMNIKSAKVRSIDLMTSEKRLPLAEEVNENQIE